MRRVLFAGYGHRVVRGDREVPLRLDIGNAPAYRLTLSSL